MNVLFKVGCLGLVLWGGPLGAENLTGFVRIANAVSRGEGPLMVYVDGVALHATGYRCGDVTGGVLLSSGRHEVRFVRDGLVSGSARVLVEPGKTMVLLPFAESPAVAVDHVPKWKIRVLRLRLGEAKQKRSATMVSVSARAELDIGLRGLDGNWVPCRVRRLRAKVVPIAQPRGYVPIRFGNQRLGSIPVTAAGSDVVVFYDSMSGALAWMSFMDHQCLMVE